MQEWLWKIQKTGLNGAMLRIKNLPYFFYKINIINAPNQNLSNYKPSILILVGDINDFAKSPG
jgi:hypothetical protein